MMVISSKTYFLPVSFQNIKVLDYSSCQITIICLLHRLQNKSRVKQVECYCGGKQEVQRELRRHHQRNEHLCNRYGRSRNVPGICTLSQWYQILILYNFICLAWKTIQWRVHSSIILIIGWQWKRASTSRKRALGPGRYC